MKIVRGRFCWVDWSSQVLGTNSGGTRDRAKERRRDQNDRASSHNRKILRQARVFLKPFR